MSTAVGAEQHANYTEVEDQLDAESVETLIERDLNDSTTQLSSYIYDEEHSGENPLRLEDFGGIENQDEDHEAEGTAKAEKEAETDVQPETVDAQVYRYDPEKNDIIPVASATGVTDINGNGKANVEQKWHSEMLHGDTLEKHLEAMEQFKNGATEAVIEVPSFKASTETEKYVYVMRYILSPDGNMRIEGNDEARPQDPKEEPEPEEEASLEYSGEDYDTGIPEVGQATLTNATNNYDAASQGDESPNLATSAIQSETAFSPVSTVVETNPPTVSAKPEAPKATPVAQTTEAAPAYAPDYAQSEKPTSEQPVEHAASTTPTHSTPAGPAASSIPKSLSPETPIRLNVPATAEATVNSAGEQLAASSAETNNLPTPPTAPGTPASTQAVETIAKPTEAIIQATETPIKSTESIIESAGYIHESSVNETPTSLLAEASPIPGPDSPPAPGGGLHTDTETTQVFSRIEQTAPVTEIQAPAIIAEQTIASSSERTSEAPVQAKEIVATPVHAEHTAPAAEVQAPTVVEQTSTRVEATTSPVEVTAPATENSAAQTEKTALQAEIRQPQTEAPPATIAQGETIQLRQEAPSVAVEAAAYPEATAQPSVETTAQPTAEVATSITESQAPIQAEATQQPTDHYETQSIRMEPVITDATATTQYSEVITKPVTAEPSMAETVQAVPAETIADAMPRTAEPNLASWTDDFGTNQDLIAPDNSWRSLLDAPASVISNSTEISAHSSQNSNSPLTANDDGLELEITLEPGSERRAARHARRSQTAAV